MLSLQEICNKQIITLPKNLYILFHDEWNHICSKCENNIDVIDIYYTTNCDDIVGFVCYDCGSECPKCGSINNKSEHFIYKMKNPMENHQCLECYRKEFGGTPVLDWNFEHHNVLDKDGLKIDIDKYATIGYYGGKFKEAIEFIVDISDWSNLKFQRLNRYGDTSFDDIVEMTLYPFELN